MLDLQPRIHLDKEHVLAIRDEFDGARADITDSGSGLARGRAYRVPLPGVQRWRWRFFHHLLMPPLRRAFPLEQRQQVAVTIANHLYLDVTRVFDDFLDQHAVIAKSSLCPAHGTENGGLQLIPRTNDSHAASA